MLYGCAPNHNMLIIDGTEANGSRGGWRGARASARSLFLQLHTMWYSMGWGTWHRGGGRRGKEGAGGGSQGKRAQGNKVQYCKAKPLLRGQKQ